MRADGQTDMTKLIVAFRNFANATKILLNYEYYSSILYIIYYITILLIVNITITIKLFYFVGFMLKNEDNNLLNL